MIVRFTIVIFLATFDALIIKIERGIGSTADAPIVLFMPPFAETAGCGCSEPVPEAPAKEASRRKTLFLQRLHLEYPAIHNCGTLAATLNEVVALFLIGRDLLFHCQIEFLRHLIPLLGIVNDVEAVDHQRRLLFIQSAEQGDEVLENIHALHKSVRDKVHMAGDTQLGGLHSPQKINADGLNLLAVCAALVEFKKLLRFSAAALHIHRIVQHEINS